MLRARFYIIDKASNNDDHDDYRIKSTLKKAAGLLNFYPSSNSALEMFPKYSNPTKERSKQPDAKESNLLNDREAESGDDFQKVNNEEISFGNLQNGTESPPVESLPYLNLSEKSVYTSSDNFSDETLFRLDLSEDDINAFMEASNLW
jgi:hypothetical protein